MSVGPLTGRWHRVVGEQNDPEVGLVRERNQSCTALLTRDDEVLLTRGREDVFFVVDTLSERVSNVDNEPVFFFEIRGYRRPLPGYRHSHSPVSDP